MLFNDEVVFSVVPVLPAEQHGLTDEQDSELESLSLEEIRFFAALSLAQRPDTGMLYVYPFPAYTTVDSETRNEEELLELAMEHARACFLGINRPRGASVPPICGGDQYRHREDSLDVSLLESLIATVSLRDHLLMRGLGAFVRAQMLFTREEFAEAATLMLFVTLESSFQVILRTLREHGLANPRAEDAAQYLEESLGKTMFDAADGYFSEWYEGRIKALHPSNRFGVFAIPPLQADDFYHLRDAMIVVYAYLIAGHKWTGLWQAKA